MSQKITEKSRRAGTREGRGKKRERKGGSEHEGGFESQCLREERMEGGGKEDDTDRKRETGRE